MSIQLALLNFYLLHIVLLTAIWRGCLMPPPGTLPESGWGSAEKLLHIIAGMGMMIFAQSFFGLTDFLGWSACVTVMVTFEIIRQRPFRSGATEYIAHHYSWRNVAAFGLGAGLGFLYFHLLLWWLPWS